MTEKNFLDDFLFENVMENNNQEEIEDQVESIEEQVEEVEEPEPKKPEKKENDVIEDDDQEEEDFGKDEDIEESESPMGELEGLYKFVANKFGFDLDDDSGFTDSLDDFGNFLEQVTNMVKPQFASPEIEQLNDYVSKGGDIQDYLRLVSNEVSIRDLDINDVQAQRHIMTEYYRKQNKDNDWIRNRISKLEEKDLLEEEATEAYDELLAFEKEEQQNLIKRQEQEIERQRELYMNYVTNVKSVIEKSDTLNGFNVPRNEKQAFFDFLVKVDKNGLTEYQKRANESMENTLTMAWLMYKGFNIDQVRKQEKTKIAKEIKKGLGKFTNGKKSSGKDNFSDLDNRSGKNNYDEFILNI